MTTIGQPVRSDDLALLSVALRTRAATPAKLAELSGRDLDEVRATLSLLEQHGYLRATRAAISYRAPSSVLVDQASRALDDATHGLAAQLAQAALLISEIPQLMDAWTMGAASRGTVDVEFFHGPNATTEFWLTYAVRRSVRATDGILPDAGPLFASKTSLLDEWVEAIVREDIRVRAILRARDIYSPRGQANLGREVTHKIDLRVMEQPPSWFWIADDAVGLPMRWGESWPTSAMMIRSEAVVSMVRWLYDQLWDAAVPIRRPQRAPAWDLLLGLMANGATLEAASRTLGISSRTGRRRVEDAMAFYGVVGHVALGAAWHADHAKPGPPG